MSMSVVTILGFLGATGILLGIALVVIYRLQGIKI